MSGTVRCTAWKFRHFRDECTVFVTPIDDDLVFIHSALTPLVFQHDGAHLLYLVRFGVVTISLQIDSFFDASLPKNVVTTFGALCEADALQQRTSILETDRRIRGTAENLAKCLLGSHADILRRFEENLSDPPNGFGLQPRRARVFCVRGVGCKPLLASIVDSRTLRTMDLFTCSGRLTGTNRLAA